MIVIDASVALAWCLKDEASDFADGVLERVIADGASAPSHWPIEMANGIRSAERQGRIDIDEVADVSQMLDQLGIEVVPVELTTALWSVLDVARTHELSAYDAAYLSLARFRGVALATLDDRLRKACKSAGVQLVD
ncbi:MAG: type II toxin-antitoxin system VapC family toxin [Chloroflexota bacterium]